MRILFKQVQPLQLTSTSTMQPTSPRTFNKKLHILPSKATQNPLSLTSSPIKLPNHTINRKWMEYQGVGNWDGLLDPLDENLRGEIIRYGQFVDAVYKAFDFNPTSTSYASSKFPKKTLLQKTGFPHSGYQITKNLHATSNINLPDWMKAAQSSWIGYVAVCNDKKEISRLGRRDIIIALRGTATTLEWLENLRATLTNVQNENPGPMVQCGILSLYTSGTNARSSLQQLVREEIHNILETYCDEPLSLTITGHSLGAALAILAAYDIKTTIKNSPLVTVISFGGPRVGNEKFRYHVEKQGTKVLRIVNSDDIVTKVPGFVLDEEAFLPRWIGTAWAYADVGRELKLTSRASPYLSNSFDVATCHELRTYLHLVDGFVSSKCPFRETARKGA